MVTPEEIGGDWATIDRIQSPSQVGGRGDETMVDTEAGDDGLKEIPVEVLAHAVLKQGISVDSSEDGFDGGGHFIGVCRWPWIVGRVREDAGDALVDAPFEATQSQVRIGQGRLFDGGEVGAGEVASRVETVGEGVLDVGVAGAGEALPFEAADVQGLAEKDRVFELVVNNLLAPHQLLQDADWKATGRHGCCRGRVMTLMSGRGRGRDVVMSPSRCRCARQGKKGTERSE